MAIYSLGLNTTVSTNGAPSYDAQAASGNNPKVMEFGLSNGASTQCTYGIGRSANTPTQSSTTTVVPENYSDPTGKTTVAVTWSVAPTIPAPFARRVFLIAAIGAGVIFTFPRGYTLQAAASSFVLWNNAASSALMTTWLVVDE